jgi:hypothetical protein
MDFGYFDRLKKPNNKIALLDELAKLSAVEDPIGMPEGMPEEAPAPPVSRTPSPGFTDAFRIMDAPLAETPPEPLKEPDKKPVIVNKVVSKDKKTNTKKEENVESLPRSEETKTDKAEPFEGIKSMLGLGKDGYFNSNDWKNQRRKLGNALVEGSEYARFNVNLKGNNPSGYTQNRTTERLEAQQKLNDQYETDSDPLSQINQELGELIKAKQSKLGRVGDISKMDREERVALLKELDYLDKMATDDQYRKAQISALNRRGIGGSGTKTSSRKLTEFEEKNGINLAASLGQLNKTIADVGNFTAQNGFDGETRIPVADISNLSGVGADSYETGRGISNPTQLSSALNKAGKAAFTAFYILSTGSAFNEHEKRLFEELVGRSSNPTLTLSERIKAMGEAQRLLEERHAVLKQANETGQIPEPAQASQNTVQAKTSSAWGAKVK